MNFSEFLQSKQFKWVLFGLGGIILLLLMFQLGLSVGFGKAHYSYRWGDRYHSMFMEPRQGMLRGFDDRGYIGGHDTVGLIISVSGSSLVIKAQNGIEKTVTMDSSTVIRQGWANLTINDLKVDEQVAVVGSPQSDGTILAKLIRVFSPEAGPSPMMPGVGPR